MKTPYTITECKRQIAAYNRYSSNLFLQQQKERWQKRLEEAQRVARLFYAQIAERLTERQLLVIRRNGQENLSLRSAAIQELWYRDTFGDGLCPDCDQPFDDHATKPASLNFCGWQPQELLCPTRVSDADKFDDIY
jgi:hypothetical protein